MNLGEQLRERDVRKNAPGLNTVDFLRRYLASNFMDTIAHPSSAQKQNLVPPSQDAGNSLKHMQKPRQGTTYDNPGGF